MRAQRIDVMLWFDSADNYMTLKDIMVDKAELTHDILSQCSEQQQ